MLAGWALLRWFNLFKCSMFQIAVLVVCVVAVDVLLRFKMVQFAFAEMGQHMFAGKAIFRRLNLFKIPPPTSNSGLLCAVVLARNNGAPLAIAKIRPTIIALYAIFK